MKGEVPEALEVERSPEEELYLEFEHALDRLSFGVAEEPLMEWYRQAVEKALRGRGFGDDLGRHWKGLLFECYREWREKELEKLKGLQQWHETLEEALYEGDS